MAKKSLNVLPYQDDEVQETLRKLTYAPELLGLVKELISKKPLIPSWLIKSPVVSNKIGNKIISYFLRKKIKGIDTIEKFQQIVAKKVFEVIEKSIDDAIEYNGIDNLKEEIQKGEESVLLVSNHIGIASDSAIINGISYYHGMKTVYCVGGGNLLDDIVMGELMRLNKFITLTRESNRFKNLKGLKEAYSLIWNLLQHKGESVLTAQSEGRAKDGNYKTDPAIFGLFYLLCKRNKLFSGEFSEFVDKSRILPVSVSYKYDPCDKLKAKELFEIFIYGSYEKEKGEDRTSTIKGIEEYKGQIAVNFGNVISKEVHDKDELAEEIDRQIIKGCRIYSSNLTAYEILRETFGFELVEPVTINDFRGEDIAAFGEKAVNIATHLKNGHDNYLIDRLVNLEAKLVPFTLIQYANIVIKKRQCGFALG